MKYAIPVEVLLTRDFPEKASSFDVLTPRPMVTIRVCQSNYYKGRTGHCVRTSVDAYSLTLKTVRECIRIAAMQIKQRIDAEFEP